ncbi:MAG: 50S ribosomal protein L4 [Neisseriaceae bacterium]|nr:50S ribosomal protein L4 [Neisseriaceae bacterium]
MELKIINAEGQVAGALTASDALFARDYNEALVHQLVTAYLANARSANRAQKTRAEVKHSTKKPWRQKGTGRARSGMTSSPLWRSGGRAFPNKPDENFTQKVNRKMYRAGMATILSQLVRDERLFVIDELAVETPKTKEFAGKVQKMGLEGDILFLTRELDENVFLSSRNLANVLVLEAHEIDPYSLLRFKKIVLTRDAVAHLEEQWV